MSEQRSVRVWDPLIRLFHWSLVAAFTVAYLTGEDESAWHIYSGYAVLGLVLFRVLWGFVGTEHARFRDFVFGPAKVLRYVAGMFGGRPRRYLGHNPLGGWMILLMLASLLATAGSGLMVYALEENAGPLAPLVGRKGTDLSLIAAARADDEHEDAIDDRHEAREEYWEELHEFFANFTLALVFIHLGGVLLGSLMHRENLARSMVTGRKKRE